MIMWIKKLAIRIFQLSDLSNLLLKSKEKQKEIDDKYWKEILKEIVDRLNREHQLELQEKDAHIAMLNQHIDTYKQREKEIDQKEFNARKQVKQNYAVAINMSSVIQEFGDNINRMYGKMQGIKESVTKNKLEIEEK